MASPPPPPSLFVVTLEDLSRPTGQSLRLRALLPHLARRFHLTLASCSDTLPVELAPHIAARWRLPLPAGARPIRWFLHPLGPWRMSRLRRALRRLPVENSILYTDSILLAEMVRPRRAARAVVEVNGSITEEFRNRGLPLTGPIRRWLERWERRAFRLPDHLIVAGAGLEQFVREFAGLAPGDRPAISVLGNGIDPARFHPGVDGARLRRRQEWGARPVGIFHGWFRSYQGVDNLIRAVPHILRRRPDFLLVLVGDGPCRADAEALADRLGVRSSIQFAGAVEAGEIAAWLAAADVALYYPRYHVGAHGFLGDAIKFYEYMGAGKPIVTVDVPQLGAPAVQAGAAIQSAATPEAFAAAVCDLLDNPDRARAMGRAGADAAHRRHTWSAVADKIADICLPP